jgi:large subunit ribosomal protein L4
MYKAPVYKADGAKTGERSCPSALRRHVNEAVMWQVVKAYLANQRQGTAAEDTQRGLGRQQEAVAPEGHRPRAPGLDPRAAVARAAATCSARGRSATSTQDVPKQVRWLARRSAYNVRAAGRRRASDRPLEVDAPKTKDLRRCSATGAGGNVLLLTDGHKPNVYLSARNLPGVQVRPFGEESAYDLLWADTLIIEAPRSSGLGGGACVIRAR